MAAYSPQNEQDIADIVRGAGKGAAIEIVGSGGKRDMGRAADVNSILHVDALAGIVSYEPDELVITARAATKLREINEVLAAEKQMLGFSPSDWGPLFVAPENSATLGGIVATGASGSRRVKAGGVRDHVIGLSFVNGMGEVIKAGGRVVKNVTGFDVPKLMAGAFGTLGVLTELTFRVMAVPEAAPVLALRNCSVEAGLKALRVAAKMPLEATGLAYLPSALPGSNFAQGAALIRIEGSAASVADKMARLKQEFAGLDPIVLEDELGASLFRHIDNGGFFAPRDNDLWRLCLPASEAANAVKYCGAKHWYADCAGGLLWLALPATLENQTRLRALTAAYGGHAMLLRASAEARRKLTVFEPEAPARAGLTRAVKLAFDPDRRLNPARMYKDM